MSKQTYPLLNHDFNKINLQILDHGLFEGDKKWTYNDIISTFTRLYFILSGDAYITNAAGTHLLQPGNLYLIPAGTTYTYTCKTKIKKFYLHTLIEIIPSVDLFYGLNTYLSRPFEKNMLEDLLILSKGNNPYHLLKVKSSLMCILAEFFHLACEEYNFKPSDNGFNKHIETLEYIKTHLSATLRISDISEGLSIPKHILTRTFKRDTGITLKYYIEQVLLQQAKYKLLTTDYSISEIATQLNFCDPYYFSRFFAKYEKISPSMYRKEN